MSEALSEHWCHCGRCGELFRTPKMPGVRTRCPECGGDPVVHPEEEEAAAAEVADARPVIAVGEADRRVARGRAGVVRFALFWIFGLLVLAGLVKWFQRDSGTAGPNAGGSFTTGFEDARVREKSFEQCRMQLQGFLSEVSPERRSQFVLNPSMTTVKMISAQQESRIAAGGELREALHFEVIDTPRGKGVEGLWDLESGQKLEAVFFETKNEGWRLDWDALVRYSTISWDLFLAGVGPDEGEFRVFGRRRKLIDRDKLDSESLVLVAPRQGAPQAVGAQSPPISVNPDSRLGRILDLAFELREADQGPYGSKVVAWDPSGMVRLRVRVKREGKTERTFHLQDILACHWLSLDDLGVSEREGED